VSSRFICRGAPRLPVALAVWTLVSVLPPSAGAQPRSSDAQKPQGSAASRNVTPPAPAAAAPVVVPADYVIGPDDVLTVFFWREKDLSGDVQVRPDGRISLPLLNDVQAAGLTPEELRVRLTQAADKFIDDPTVTVVVKAINSRRIYITGQVSKPGVYPLGGPMTVVQLIATAGGVLEYADEKNIVISRTEAGKALSFRFNYDEFKRGRRLEQNIQLKPGDTVIVP
jgi:polysaccharide biosynthesis/export protein